MRHQQVLLDDLDRTLVNRLQDGLPLVAEPYAAVAEELGITETLLLERLERLVDERALTRFGPMFDVEKLGGAFCLCAMALPEDAFQSVVEIVNSFDEVAHNYERDHQLNMWFVLATETRNQIQSVADRIERKTGYPVLLFPKEREFFIRLKVAV
ncbi:AsnC family transcriptional regulator [Coralliovum pocilloporae]|uniref:AsnC family transcriptional regulator n=1 Tax=Coralliovum pocilloporae TaxID=3066369 RepID=UPI003307BDA4